MSTSDAARRAPTPADNRDALIEQLLLSGLDHYFSGRYEHAIHLWTRVFFIDRGHARAKAYIERARSALAETQRQAEARAHGEGECSRIAIGPSAIATFADWTQDLPRLASTTDSAALRPDHDPSVTRGDGDTARGAEADEAASGDTVRTLVHVGIVAVAAVLLFGAGYLVAARDDIAAWWRGPAEASAVPAIAPDPLPLPRSSELALSRARAAYARGRLHDALHLLETIPVDDPRRREADALLVDVQRALVGPASVLDDTRAPVGVASDSPARR